HDDPRIGRGQCRVFETEWECRLVRKTWTASVRCPGLMPFMPTFPSRRIGEWLRMSEAATALGVSDHLYPPADQGQHFCPLRRSCGSLRTRSEPPTCKVNGWLRRLRAQVAGVTPISKNQIPMFPEA